MSSILNKYKRWTHLFHIVLDKYWDFCLSIDNSPSVPIDGNLTEDCLVSFIDFTNPLCISGGTNAVSLPSYVYQENEDETIKDIGLTGIDNGLISYDKSRITNQEFLNILTGTTMTIGSNALTLYPVTGNTGRFAYDCKYNPDGYYEFRGGFLQGFYKMFGFNYQTLPQYIENDWHMEFVLRPNSAYKTDGNTLNDEYPNNNGIFFYMGTRAEDKFKLIDKDYSDIYETRTGGTTLDCDSLSYVEGSSIKESESEDEMGMQMHMPFWRYFLYVYGFSDKSDCGCRREDKKKKSEEGDCSNYFDSDSDYVKDDTSLSDVVIQTSNGKDVTDNDKYLEVTTDNKFLTFDRTKDGFTVDTFDENTEVTFLEKIRKYPINPFLYFNRTKTGATVHCIEHNGIKEVEGSSTSSSETTYDCTKDVKGNSFALKINTDGSIGYRYAVKSCDEEYADNYIVEEKSYSGIVETDKWSTINVKFHILNGSVDDCGVPYGQRHMKIYIYVNGFLKFISKELPEFAFRELDNDYDRQEGVPFNISLGGGSQGLAESVWLDYSSQFPYILPIEKNFGGSFIGDIKAFRFYTCSMQFAQIENNYIYENNKQDGIRSYIL